MPFITINGHSLHYTDISPSEGQDAKLCLILVHGLGSTQNYYFPIFPHVRDFRCIIFDNYAAGRSKYNGKEASITGIANDVVGLLDHLHVSKAVVIGYSMGGMVPTLLAATQPDRVIGGVCIGPVHPTEAVAEVFKKRIPTVQEGGIEAMANTIPHGATGSKATALQKAFIREMILGQDPEGYIANCRAIQHATPPEYAQVKCPMLIIAGAEDKSAPLAGCQKIFEELGTPDDRKSLQVLEGVGHWHCVEAPDEVGPLIQQFCEGLL